MALAWSMIVFDYNLFFQWRQIQNFEFKLHLQLFPFVLLCEVPNLPFQDIIFIDDLIIHWDPLNTWVELPKNSDFYDLQGLLLEFLKIKNLVQEIGHVRPHAKHVWPIGDQDCRS